METHSLKVLADKVFQRNQPVNLKETPSFPNGKPPAGNFTLPKAVKEPPLETAGISLSPSLKDFQTLFEKANAELVAAYLHGTLELIREEYPDLSTKIQKAEDHINDLWRTARQGIGNLRDFKAAVEKWQALHLKAIELVLRILEAGNEKI
jgi:hypothetical protein